MFYEKKLLTSQGCGWMKLIFRYFFLLLWKIIHRNKCFFVIVFCFVCFSSWSLDNADKLLKALEIPKYIETGNVYPEDYKRLFCALQNSSVFTESWFHDEVLESIRNINLWISSCCLLEDHHCFWKITVIRNDLNKIEVLLARWLPVQTGK